MHRPPFAVNSRAGSANFDCLARWRSSVGLATQAYLTSTAAPSASN